MSKKQIIVVQSGWVLIGMVSEKAGKMRVTDGAVIRVWGTTAGLGEIAIKGPTKETVLDHFGDGEVPLNAVLFTIDCRV